MAGSRSPRRPSAAGGLRSRSLRAEGTGERHAGEYQCDERRDVEVSPDATEGQQQADARKSPPALCPCGHSSPRSSDHDELKPRSRYSSITFPSGSQGGSIRSSRAAAPPSICTAAMRARRRRRRRLTVRSRRRCRRYEAVLAPAQRRCIRSEAARMHFTIFLKTLSPMARIVDPSSMTSCIPTLSKPSPRKRSSVIRKLAHAEY